MKIRNAYYLLIMVITLVSCKKDDNGIAVTPPAPLSKIIAQDEMKLQEYFATHFYNYEEFEAQEEGFDYEIRIDTIAGENSDKISLKDSENFGFETLVVKSANVGITDGAEEIEHKVYYLVAKQGLGATANFADSTYVEYKGTLLDGTLFDSSTSPVWFNLPNEVSGFAHGITSLRAGNGYEENVDGTFEVKDYGIGMLFIPSALGYYATTEGAIPPYSPIVFKIDLLAVNPTDHDSDGIPSYLEDLDGDGRLANDNTDLDIEKSSTFILVPNYLDADDDGDGTLTKEEINLDTNGNFIGFRDTDGDGIFDHLDKDTR